MEKQKSVNIILLPALQKKLGGVSKATVYRMMHEGRLPQSIKLGSRSVGWIENSIDEMLLSRTTS